MCTGFAWHAAISHNPVRTITPGPSRSTATHRYKPPLWVHQRERERWEKGLRNETSKSNREDEMGWSKDLKASITDRGAVLRSETYTLVLSSPSSSSSILHLGPVGLCSHLLSLSLALCTLLSSRLLTRPGKKPTETRQLEPVSPECAITLEAYPEVFSPPPSRYGWKHEDWHDPEDRSH